jgi:hypothetical protein
MDPEGFSFLTFLPSSLGIDLQIPMWLEMEIVWYYAWFGGPLQQ